MSRLFVGRPVAVRSAAQLVVLSVLLSAVVFGVVSAAGAFPRTVVDDIGQEIFLAEPPQRIVSVGLAMDNILLSVTDPERVVGVTRWAAGSGVVVRGRQGWTAHDDDRPAQRGASVGART